MHARNSASENSDDAKRAVMDANTQDVGPWTLRVALDTYHRMSAELVEDVLRV